MRPSQPVSRLLPSEFDSVREEDRELLRETGTLLTLAKERKVLRKGERHRFGYFLHSGWCAGGDAARFTHLQGPGSVVMAGPTEDTIAPADVTTLSAVLLVGFDLKVLHSVGLRNPTLLAIILDRALRILSAAHRSYALKGTNLLEYRIADALWGIGIPTPDGARIVPLAITQAVLASALGASREEVSRKRKLLVKAGYLYKQNGNWCLSTGVPLLLAGMPATLSELG